MAAQVLSGRKGFIEVRMANRVVRPELVISDHCWRKRSPEIRRSRQGGPFRSKSLSRMYR
jgi:hypothetical protein